MTDTVVLVVCTVGRPDIVRSQARHLDRLSPKPALLIYVVACDEDLPSQSDLPAQLEFVVLKSEKGLPRQRNRALDYVVDRFEYIFFIDDDYVPSTFAISQLRDAFSISPECVGITGRLLADGVNEGGVNVSTGDNLIEKFDSESGFGCKKVERDLIGLYGCNMAFRLRCVGMTRFDEDLPLYAWQEDVDFSSRLAGEKIKSHCLVGVHLGVQSGREVDGRALGYSQVANLVYLVSKGSLPWRYALRLTVRNILANHFKQFLPEGWIDRRGRARGNRMALLDVLFGRAHPARVLQPPFASEKADDNK